MGSFGRQAVVVVVVVVDVVVVIVVVVVLPSFLTWKTRKRDYFLINHKNMFTYIMYCIH